MGSELFETYNGNSWPTLRERLTTSSALILLAQEIGFTLDDEGDKCDAVGKLGWRMLAAPAVPGLSGKPKWGAAVLVRQHLGLRWPSDGSGIVEH
eukprot:7310923-Pyramimonas_sp.AAC.1